VSRPTAAGAAGRAAAVALALAALLAAAPRPALGQASDFVPHVDTVEGWLEFGGLYEDRTEDANGRSRSVRDTYFTERIQLSATGWVYHPRFLLFLGRVGGGFAQEDFRSDFSGVDTGGYQTTTLGEYELRALLLAEHPYNLELYTLRRNPYQRGRSAPGTEYVGDESGAVFRVRSRPYAMTVSYRDTSFDSSGYERDTETFGASGTWFRDWTSLTGNVSRATTDSAFAGVGTHHVEDEYGAENQLRLYDSRVTLGSIVGYHVFDQQGLSERVEDTRFSWDERLQVRLPYSLELGARYSRLDETSRRTGEESGELTSESDSWGFSALHRLYLSLTTTYDYAATSAHTTTGDTDSTAQTLAATYVKNIPRGVLTANADLRRASVERTGTPGVLGEAHAAALFGEFTLQEADADPAAVRVVVRSPVTGAQVEMLPGVHFRAFVLGRETRVRIEAIPAAAVVADPLYVYAFTVDYLLVEERQSSDTDGWGAGLKVELFDGLFSPYATYSLSDETNVDARGFSETLETRTTTFGLVVQRLPWSALAERQTAESDLNPYQRDRVEVTGRGDLTASLQLFGQVQYARTHYDEGRYQPEALTEQGTTATVRLQQRWPQRKLILVVGAVYNHATGLGTRTSSSVDAELTWTVRQLELSANVSLGSSRIDQAGRSSDSLRQLYFLRVTRRLF
jgi:hypothetical protein